MDCDSDGHKKKLGVVTDEGYCSEEMGESVHETNFSRVWNLRRTGCFFKGGTTGGMQRKWGGVAWHLRAGGGRIGGGQVGDFQRQCLAFAYSGEGTEVELLRLEEEPDRRNDGLCSRLQIGKGREWSRF